MRIPAYHLPPSIAAPPAAAARDDLEATAAPATGSLGPALAEIELPALTPAALAAVAERLLEAGAALRSLPLDDRIAALGRAAAAWQAPGSRWRRLALERLPLITGYPTRAVAQALDHLWSALEPAELHATVASELGAAPPAAPPRLALHVLAGNVPGAGIFGVVAALLAGVPSLVKSARREPLLPALIARSIAAEDARLGAALAVAHWPGGSAALDRAAIARADLVLAYGRGETLDHIAAHEPRRLLRFGPRLSVGVVAHQALDPGTAADAAWQAALFDQQGCLSLQLLCIEEPHRGAAAPFVQALVHELERLASSMPRAPLTLAESTAVWRFLERQRWRAQEGAPVEVLADAAGRFGVVCDRSGAIVASPLNRLLVVVPVASLAAAGPLLARLRGMVEAVGYAGPEARIGDAATAAAACDATRLCPLARMQAPPFAWRQSGLARLGSLVDAPPATPVALAAP